MFRFRTTIWLENLEGRELHKVMKIRTHSCPDEEQFRFLVRKEFYNDEVAFGPITKSEIEDE